MGVPHKPIALASALSLSPNQLLAILLVKFKANG
jgi:hypothetical protein